MPIARSHQPGAIGHHDIGSGRCISLSSSAFKAGLSAAGLCKAELFNAGVFILKLAEYEEQNEIGFYCLCR